MIIEVVSTGTELLLGHILNTNAPFLSEKCNDLGFDVLYHSTVGDNYARMQQVFSTALERAEIVLVSGGLGPTLGDITKEVVAELLGKPLLPHAPTIEKLEQFFAARGKSMPQNNLRQAMLPEGAVVFPNERGTAPGMAVEERGKIIILLPGPPHELEWMFMQQVIPYLIQKTGQQGCIVSRILHTFGIGESQLAECLHSYIKAQTNPTIALLARQGEVIIRLTAKDASREAAQQRIEALESGIRREVGQYIWGVDDETLETALGQLLNEKQQTVAFAESCTGGLISSRITDIAGSSAYFLGSVISYANEVKRDQLSVSESVLSTYGAVSEPTALAMAAGVRRRIGTSIGIGVTGIAGPGGGTAAKPVGTVYIAIDGPNGSYCEGFAFTGERTAIKYRASQAALHILRQYLIDIAN